MKGPVNYKRRLALLLTVFMGLGICWLLFSGSSWTNGTDGHMENRNLDFTEYHGEYEEHTFFDFVRWRFQRLAKSLPAPLSYQFKLVANDPQFLQANQGKKTVTWIGHATLLLQLDGKNILTDPHFSGRASPVQWAGPARVVQPGLSMEDLPPIDLVLISHDHYDSLDKESIKGLSIRPGGDGTVFVVPLGVGTLLHSWGAKNIVELDWWQETTVSGLKVIATPLQHWSKRSLWDRNKRLWAGWVILAENFRFCFVGDTGYNKTIFREIQERYGPFDLGAIPIGAYEPRWFMAMHHINPREAVQIHKDLSAKKSIAIHWGTFVLTDEPLDEPPKLLAEEKIAQGVDPADFVILQHGQTLILDDVVK